MGEKDTQEKVVELADKKALNFFERIYYAIFKLDKYNEFVDEKVKTGIKYLLILLFLVSVIIITLGIFNTTKMLNRIADFVKTDFPDFTYSKGVLKAENAKEIRDEDLDLYFVIDTSDLTEKQLADYVGNATNSYYGVLFLKEKMSFTVNGSSMEYNYDDLQGAEVEDFNKEDVLNLLNQGNIFKVSAIIFLAGLLTTYLNITLVTVINICMVFVIGYIISMMIKLPIKASSVFNISIYSFTLSIFLNLLYSIVYYFAGFKMDNFDTIYMIVAYIYVIAALLILKQNMINTDMVAHSERQVTIEDLKKQEEKEEKESEEELNRLENEKKEQKKKRQGKRKLNPKESLEEKEPDGSEI